MHILSTQRKCTPVEMSCHASCNKEKTDGWFEGEGREAVEGKEREVPLSYVGSPSSI